MQYVSLVSRRHFQKHMKYHLRTHCAGDKLWHLICKPGNTIFVLIVYPTRDF